MWSVCVFCSVTQWYSNNSCFNCLIKVCLTVDKWQCCVCLLLKDCCEVLKKVGLLTLYFVLQRVNFVFKYKGNSDCYTNDMNICFKLYIYWLTSNSNEVVAFCNIGVQQMYKFKLIIIIVVMASVILLKFETICKVNILWIYNAYSCFVVYTPNWPEKARRENKNVIDLFLAFVHTIFWFNLVIN